MFTGIVEAGGKVKSVEPKGSFVRLVVTSDLDFTDLRVGDSIAVNGACLTASMVDKEGRLFAADVSPETLRITTLGDLRPGSGVNLEKALRLDSRLGGHMVSGHIDCIGRVNEKRKVGEGFLLGFSVESTRYLIPKGSVAIDGVSLTVNNVENNAFWVMIIPHTSLLTGLTRKNVGDKVNIEFDLIGKYVEKFVSAVAPESGVDENTLKRHGFI